MPVTPLTPWFVVHFHQASGVRWVVLVPLGLYQYDCWWSVHWPRGYISLQTGHFSGLQGSKGFGFFLKQYLLGLQIVMIIYMIF